MKLNFSINQLQREFCKRLFFFMFYGWLQGPYAATRHKRFRLAGVL